jgi:hypothetical protein
MSESRRTGQPNSSSDSIKIIQNPKVGGQSNSIAVIQDSYGGGLVANDSIGAVQNNLKATQPKSEQKFRSQTQENAINRNRNNKFNNPNVQAANIDTTAKSSARERNAASVNVNVKQKAVR